MRLPSFLFALLPYYSFASFNAPSLFPPSTGSMAVLSLPPQTMQFTAAHSFLGTVHSQVTMSMNVFGRKYSTICLTTPPPSQRMTTSLLRRLSTFRATPLAPRLMILLPLPLGSRSPVDPSEASHNGSG